MPELYTTTCHKVKATLDMVNDHHFSAVVETLRKMSIEKMYGSDVFHQKVSDYKRPNEEIIEILRKMM